MDAGREPTDDELVLLTRDGSIAAFNSLVDRHQDHAFNLCFRLLGDRGAAEDATQEAFLSAYRSIRSYTGGNFRSWLLRIAANASKDELRRRGRKPADSLDELRDREAAPFDPPDAADTQAEVERLELTATIQAAVETLPFDQRHVIVLVDVPGYLPGVGQEWDGVVRRGAKLLHAFGECVVPRISLVTRKTYGGAYVAMNSRALGATKVFAWPGAQVAVMGSVAAIRILHRRKLAEVAPDLRAQVELELAAEHEAIAGGVDKAVEIGVVDEVVEPSATRSAIARAIHEAVQTQGVRRGAHGNIPL